LGEFNAPINRQATAMTNEQSLHFLGKLTYHPPFFLLKSLSESISLFYFRKILIKGENPKWANFSEISD